MKVFVAGATGAVGGRFVPVLVQAGHSVVAMTRSPARGDALRAAGAEPVVADALNREAVIEAVRKAQPEVIVHQLTAIDPKANIRKFDSEFELTDRLRTEGLDNLLAGARAAGARRIVAQSYGGWIYAPKGGPVKTEDDPLDPSPAPRFRRSLDAIRYLESSVTGAAGIEGLALRYGWFYGPGSSIVRGGHFDALVTKRRFPIVGKGTGIWSFIHMDDVARATLAAVEGGAPGVYNVADDEPAAVSEWLPDFASVIGAKPPRRVPTFVGRMAAGATGLAIMTQIRGMSNAKAKRELGWTPMYPSWRDGFRKGMS